MQSEVNLNEQPATHLDIFADFGSELVYRID
jgi:hypothetical protein